MNEYGFNLSLREALLVRGFKFWRVESHQTCPGIPDCHFIHKPTAMTGWMEVKLEENLPTRMPYQPRQAAWLREYSLMGGNCWTVLRVDKQDLIVVVPGAESLRAEVSLMESQPVFLRFREDRWDTLSEYLLLGVKGLKTKNLPRFTNLPG